MRQADLNRAVARATGETVRTIEERGFQIVMVPIPRPSPKAKYRRRPQTPKLLRTA